MRTTARDAAPAPGLMLWDVRVDRSPCRRSGSRGYGGAPKGSALEQRSERLQARYRGASRAGETATRAATGRYTRPRRPGTMGREMLSHVCDNYERLWLCAYGLATRARRVSPSVAALTHICKADASARQRGTPPASAKCLCHQWSTKRRVLARDLRCSPPSQATRTTRPTSGSGPGERHHHGQLGTAQTQRLSLV